MVEFGAGAFPSRGFGESRKTQAVPRIKSTGLIVCSAVERLTRAEISPVQQNSEKSNFAWICHLSSLSWSHWFNVKGTSLYFFKNQGKSSETSNSISRNSSEIVLNEVDALEYDE
jgi:hypothetical protein